MTDITCVLTNSIEQVRFYVDQGYCPIECSIGGESIIDNLKMDHHGKWSTLEGVAIRAYRDHFEARANDPRFVVVGSADADATFAIAALAGLLHDPFTIPRASLNRPDCLSLAHLIDRIDRDPIGVNFSNHYNAHYLLTWNALMRSSRDTLGLYTGVGLWVNLLTAPAGRLAPLFVASMETEKQRIAQATMDLSNRSENIDGVVFMNQPEVWGFDTWYGRKDASSPNTPLGWRHPVIVAWTKDCNITIGCPNVAVAEAIFGEGGLKNVFPSLDAFFTNPELKGWGGRESVGGSPRGIRLQVSDAMASAAHVATLIQDQGKWDWRAEELANSSFFELD